MQQKKKFELNKKLVNPDLPTEKSFQVIFANKVSGRRVCAVN